jgi:hypothetical protein
VIEILPSSVPLMEKLSFVVLAIEELLSSVPWIGKCTFYTILKFLRILLKNSEGAPLLKNKFVLRRSDEAAGSRRCPRCKGLGRIPCVACNGQGVRGIPIPVTASAGTDMVSKRAD